MVAGVAMNALPFLFVYQLITPLLTHGTMSAAGVIGRIAAIAVCVTLYAVLYIHGLSLSHRSAYHTLENIRYPAAEAGEAASGRDSGKGRGRRQKNVHRRHRIHELLLAHALPEGLSNLAVPALVYLGMFLADWKLALLSLCSLPLGLWQRLPCTSPAQ
jgi:ATP-binding cassette subfamily B protein